MKGTPLTLTDVIADLGRLTDVFTRPRHAPADVARFAEGYLHVCSDVSREQFTQGVTAYLKTDARFFPKPGQVRALALGQPGASPLAGGTAEAQFREWLKGDWCSPCPVCGGTIHSHDHARHVALDAPCVGRCNAEPGTCCSPYARERRVPDPEQVTRDALRAGA